MGIARAFEVAGFKPGILNAGADLSAKQFFAVKVDTDGDVVLGGDGDLCIGIVQNKPVENEAAEVECDGVSKAVAGAAVANAGTKLAANADGKLITAASAKHVVAIALQPAAGDGSIFAVKVVGAAGQLLA